MIIKSVIVLTITLIGCSGNEFTSSITPEATKTETGDSKEETTEVTAEPLPENEDGSIVASNVWQREGKPLVDVNNGIEGNISTVQKIMRYNSRDGSTQIWQRNRSRTFTRTWRESLTTKEETETYRQSSANIDRPLDILLVIDTSGSMSEERIGLGTRLSVLLRHVETTNWRLAITTTDADQCLEDRWIISKDPPASKFNRSEEDFIKIISELSNGIDGCGEICDVYRGYVYPNHPPERDNERPILMAINGLGGEKTKRGLNNLCRGRRSLSPLKRNNDWLRKDSMIAVILVTDEDNSEHSTMVDQRDIDLKTSELTKYLEGTLQKIKGTSYEIYGLLNPSARESYLKIIDDEDNVQDVRSTNYNTVLSNISTGIMTVLNKTLDISNITDKNGFTFEGIADMIKGIHYTRNGDTITFMDNYIPRRDQNIIVKYSYQIPSNERAITLTYPPLNNVTVTKVLGCGRDWRNDSVVKTCAGKPCVVHSSRPPDGCKLRYQYKRSNLPLFDKIRLNRPMTECSIVKNTINLTIDKISRGFSYNSSTRELSFTPLSDDDGKIIKATYTCRKKILTYKYRTGISDTNITCIPIDCTYTRNTGQITIQESAFANHKRFVIQRAISPDKKQFELEDGYVANSISLTVTDSNDNKATCEASKLIINNNIVPLNTPEAKNKCSALENMHKVSLTYQRQQEHLFEFGNDFFNANPHKDEQWQVSIDGKKLATDAYELDKDARTVKLKSVPAPGAKIEIKVDLLW